MTTTVTETVGEVATLTEATTDRPAGRRWRARIIEGDVWGSSGYYSREVLERDGPHAWPESTQVYFDHPSASDAQDRPERSVRDLAGRIASTPVYEGDGLYADVEIYPHAAAVVEAMAADIGLSIRAAAEVEQGEAAGRRGTVITRLTEGFSVDLVTRAGAGGRLVTLLESATYSHGFTPVDENTTGVRLAGTLATNTTNVPVVPAGQSTEENHMHQIEESELTRLREADGRVTAAEAAREAAVTERDTAITERDEARRMLAAERARTAARTHVDTRVREANSALPDPTVARIVEAATREVPLTDAGALDTAALDTAADTARTAEESYLAALSPQAGTPSGFGARGTGTAAEESGPFAAGSAFLTESADGPSVDDFQKRINERVGATREES